MPSSSSRCTQAGASRTNSSTAERSHSPAPALRVSSTWLQKLSSGRVTAAMPPCAQRLAERGSRSLLNSNTLRPGGSSSAAISPAAPPPTTITSQREGSCVIQAEQAVPTKKPPVQARRQSPAVEI